jgi:hypothetical protein
VASDEWRAGNGEAERERNPARIAENGVTSLAQRGQLRYRLVSLVTRLHLPLLLHSPCQVRELCKMTGHYAVPQNPSAPDTLLPGRFRDFAVPQVGRPAHESRALRWPAPFSGISLFAPPPRWGSWNYGESRSTGRRAAAMDFRGSRLRRPPPETSPQIEPPVRAGCRAVWRTPWLDQMNPLRTPRPVRHG